MDLFLSRLLLPTAALALLASPVVAQRPALTGEMATVAEAVEADPIRLAELQTRHGERTRVDAADVRDVNFAPTSGAQLGISYASMNAWAASAPHSAQPCVAPPPARTSTGTVAVVPAALAPPYHVALPVREVRYDADREVPELAVA